MRQRLPLCSAQRFRAVCVVWMVGLAVAAFCLWSATQGAGGIEGAAARVPAGHERASWIYGVVLLLFAPTAVLLWHLPRWMHTIVVDETGITLERLGRPRWHLPWDDYAGWRRHLAPEYGGGTATLALRLCRRSGKDRKVPMVDDVGPLLAALQREGVPGEQPPLNDPLNDARVIKMLTVATVLLVVLALGMLVYFTSGPR
jgi:hypothetical protein